MPVKNENNQVALRFLRGGQKYIRTSQNEYVFTPNNGVSLAWIEEKDVNQILRIQGGCCGNHQKPIFVLANQGHIDLWLGKQVNP